MMRVSTSENGYRVLKNSILLNTGLRTENSDVQSNGDKSGRRWT